jgi:hypothetical protein
MIKNILYQLEQFHKPIPSNTSWAFKLMSFKYDLLMKWDRLIGRKPEVDEELQKELAKFADFGIEETTKKD